MSTRSVLAGAVVASCLLAACGSTHAVNTLGTTSTTGAKGAATTGKAGAGSGSSTTAKAAASGSSTSAAGSASTTRAGAGTAKVEVAKTGLGQVLVDAEGRTLYLYTKDTQGKASTCAGSCAVTWPPVEVKDKPAAGAGIDASKLTTIKRADGTEQVAYDGWPLYRYDGDKKAGDTTGQGVNSVWYAVSPAGTPVAA